MKNHESPTFGRATSRVTFAKTRCVSLAWRYWIGAGVIAFLTLCVAPRDSAQVTIYVNTTQQGVTDGLCSLQEAIYATEFRANIAIGSTDPDATYTTGCTAGAGNGDTIVLEPGALYTFDQFWAGDGHNIYGPTATPLIFSQITILGNGATLQWVGAGNSRLFAIGPLAVSSFPSSGTGHLVLDQVYIKGFHVKGGDGGGSQNSADGVGGGGGLGAGGAIFVAGGSGLVVSNSTFDSNGAFGGEGGSCTPLPIGVPVGTGPDCTESGGPAEILEPGGGGGLSGNGGSGGEGTGAGGGGGGSRGNGGAAIVGTYLGGGGGGGGTVDSGGDGGETVGGPGGYTCGGAGGAFQGNYPSSNYGLPASCPGGGGGGGGANTSGNSTCVITCDVGNGAGGSYGGGGGGGNSGGNGGFGGGGGAASGYNLNFFFYTTSVSGGNGGFGGGGGADCDGSCQSASQNPGKGGPFGGHADNYNGGGGGALGGAIFSQNSTVIIFNSTFYNNDVARGFSGGGNAENGGDGGGAIFSLNGSLEITDATFSNNHSTGSGGAVVVYSNTGGSPAVTFDLYDTIIADNGANECFFTGTVKAEGNGNLITHNGSGSGPFSPCRGVVTTLDPQLQPLQLNSPGNTPTMAILTASPAKNKANSASSLPFDQRFVTRPQDGGYDIGAYEARASNFSFSAVPNIPVQLSVAITGAPAGGSGSATVTVNSFEYFDAPVTLSAATSPGITATFSPNPITPPYNGSTSTTMTVTVGPTVAAGTYPLTITGTSSSQTQTVTTNVVVEPIVIP
jgi:hypothetical protein